MHLRAKQQNAIWIITRIFLFLGENCLINWDRKWKTRNVFFILPVLVGHKANETNGDACV